MKKSIISVLLLLLLMFTLAFYIYNAKNKRDNFFILDNNIDNIVSLNKDFNIYLKDTLQYNNFDIIQSKIDSFKDELKSIKNNKLFIENISEKLKQTINKLENSINEKFILMEKIKSYSAILNNSFRNIQKLKKNGTSEKYNTLFTVIMTIDNNPELNMKEEEEKLHELLSNNREHSDAIFLKHAEIIFHYHTDYLNIYNSLEQLNIDKQLKNLHYLYEQYSQKSLKKAQIAISILFLLLFLSIIVFLVYEYKLLISNKDLYKFRHAIENSDNIVVITDTNEIITYVNDAFTKTTGYTYDEAIGQKPNILKSDKKPQKFYDDLHETIFSGNKWSGDFINVDKHGNLSYEKASILPVMNDNGEIYEFIAIKLDVTNETITREKLKEKEKLLVQQSKMASMGEMLENIAHQWRQPLSTISTAASGLHVQKELDMVVSKETELDLLEKITETTQYLSQTINDFRDFFKTNKEKNTFNLKDVYYKTLNLVNSKFLSLKIEVIENIENIEITSLDNEIIQVIMNLLNNARDALETKGNQKRLIFVDIYEENNIAIIKIKDNGGGVPSNIIDKVFEPYFTTKHKAQGTGIGLYMSQEMVVKHMNGTISVNNIVYTHDSIEYTGAEFTINIPTKQ